MELFQVPMLCQMFYKKMYEAREPYTAGQGPAEYRDRQDPKRTTYTTGKGDLNVAKKPRKQQ